MILHMAITEQEIQNALSEQQIQDIGYITSVLDKKLISNYGKLKNGEVLRFSLNKKYNRIVTDAVCKSYEQAGWECSAYDNKVYYGMWSSGRPISEFGFRKPKQK